MEALRKFVEENDILYAVFTDIEGKSWLEFGSRKMVPQQHLDFARKILTDHGVPVADDGTENALQLLGWTEATATPQVAAG